MLSLIAISDLNACFRWYTRAPISIPTPSRCAFCDRCRYYVVKRRRVCLLMTSQVLIDCLSAGCRFTFSKKQRAIRTESCSTSSISGRNTLCDNHGYQCIRIPSNCNPRSHFKVTYAVAVLLSKAQPACCPIVSPDVEILN
jgi:hypothetical protein